MRLKTTVYCTVYAALATAFIPGASAIANELMISCLLKRDVHGSKMNNPVNITMTVDVDGPSVLLMGVEPQRNVNISPSAIAFTRGDNLFSIDRGTGYLQVISKTEPENIATGTC